MDVKEILSGVSVEHLQGETNCDVSNICHKAQECSLGSLFVAIRGAKSDGHDFIEKAIANGARFIMHETDFVPALGITAIKVMSSRTALGVIAKNFYHDPSSKLTVIGVTGTNGKTTTTYLIESILQMAGKTVGVIGTVNYRYNGETYPAINTTPDSLELQRILYEMHKTGVDCVVMEVSSHALDMKRVDECNFDVGIFTNLTQDHLDYHHT
ncbi:MAG: Mur ligase family protein, partial [Deltaproteobacteria bacterium]